MPNIIQNLSTLKKLRIISIQSNRITKIEGLEELTELEELYMSHNGVQRIEGLQNNVRTPRPSHPRIQNNDAVRIYCYSSSSTRWTLAIIKFQPSRICLISNVLLSSGYVVGRYYPL
jgi:Leucine-rich repeat (LRR) protein